MEKITTEEVMDNLDLFQYRFGKIDKFGWQDLERISADASMQFTSAEFKEECQTRRVYLTLAATEHKEMKGQVEVTWRMLRSIAHSLMVHARVLEAYIHFALMYTIYHIFPVLPIKCLINQDGDLTTPYKHSTDTKPTVSHLRLFFCPCFVQKATAHIETKALNMRHKAQKGFLRYLCWNSTASKNIFCGRTDYKEDNIFI